MTASTGSPGSARGFAVTMIAAWSGWSATGGGVVATVAASAVGAGCGSSAETGGAAVSAGADVVLTAAEGGVMTASAGALASRMAVEKAVMLIGYRLSLYTFIGATFRTQPFSGLTGSQGCGVRRLGDAPYQQLSTGRNENCCWRKHFSSLQATVCKPISCRPRFAGFLLE